MINIENQPIDTNISSRRKGVNTLRHTKDLRIGAGDTIMGAGIEGLWLGAKKYENAPFRVNMEGDLEGISLSAPTITGGSITGSTITGGTVSTSSGIEAVVMDGINNTLDIYEEISSTERLRMRLGAGGLLFNAPTGTTSGSIYGFGANSIGISTDSYVTQISSGDIITSDSSRSIGRSGDRWDTIYLVNSPDVSSDIRLKKEIKPLKYGIEEIKQINPIEFKRDDETVYLGFSAQELQKILPEMVKDGKYLSITETSLIPVLVNAVKELKKEIEEIKSNMV